MTDNQILGFIFWPGKSTKLCHFMCEETYANFSLSTSNSVVNIGLRTETWTFVRSHVKSSMCGEITH